MIENKGKEDFNEIIALYFDIDIKLIQGIQFLNLIVFAIFYIGFRTILSSSKTNFAKIVNLIKDDPIFPNNSLLSQYSVEIQVIVTLNHLGCDGNGASIGALGVYIVGISTGTVIINLTNNRVFWALYNLRDQIIFWPYEGIFSYLFILFHLYTYLKY